MADKKSRFGFGTKEDIGTAVEAGTINEYDFLCLDNGEVGWIDANKKTVINTPRTQTDIKVNGVTGLGIGNNETITAGKSLDEIVKMLVQKPIPATYTKPSVSIANNGGSASGDVEAGTSVTPKLRATFNKNDAGDLTKLEILKGGQSVGSGTATPYDYSGEAIVIGDETVTFTAKATYNEGAIKNNNLGQQSPNGHIAAGSVTSGNYSINGRRNMFYGTGVGATPSLTSDVVRGLANTRLNPTQGTVFNIPSAIGQQYVVFAYPATLRDVNQIFYVEANDPGMASSFKKTLVDVADARGGENGKKSYKVYSYAMATPAAAGMTFKVTI